MYKESQSWDKECQDIRGYGDTICFQFESAQSKPEFMQTHLDDRKLGELAATSKEAWDSVPLLSAGGFYALITHAVCWGEFLVLAHEN